MTHAIDLDAYFRRIGYSGSREPSLDTLRNIHRRHTQTIPFENLNPLLGWPVNLDAGSLQEKLIQGHRGGYCYEQNLLVKHVLDALGFLVTGLAARVMWNNPAGSVMPRTHMLLKIDVDGQPWMADAGFGGLTPTAPLRLDTDDEQPTPHGPYRLSGHQTAEFILHTHLDTGWSPLYRFTLQEQLQPDYEMANFYVSRHPGSRFVNGLMAARATPERRFTLLNNQFSIRDRNGGTERWTLSSVAKMRDVLENCIDVRLPDTPSLDSALQRLIDTRPAII